jgi:hypothetical protein
MRTQSISTPARPYLVTAAASAAMNTPRFAELLVAWWKYWQPPQPPTESTIFVPCPLLFAAATRRWSMLWEPLSHDSWFDDDGVTKAVFMLDMENYDDQQDEPKKMMSNLEKSMFSGGFESMDQSG